MLVEGKNKIVILEMFRLRNKSDKNEKVYLTIWYNKALSCVYSFYATAWETAKII